MDEPRAMTSDEMMSTVIDHLEMMVQYWATVESPMKNVFRGGGPPVPARGDAT